MCAKGYGLQVEDLPELDLISNIDGAGKDKVPEVGGYRNEWATAGFFGRLNYDYKGRYLAEANLRYDGTSRFRRRGNRCLIVPSFSLSLEHCPGKLLGRFCGCLQSVEVPVLLW